MPERTNDAVDPNDAVDTAAGAHQADVDTDTDVARLAARSRSADERAVWVADRTPDFAQRCVSCLTTEVSDVRRLRLRGHPTLDALARAVDLNLLVVFDFGGELERIDGLTHAFDLARSLEGVAGLTDTLDPVAAEDATAPPSTTGAAARRSPGDAAGAHARAVGLALDLAEDLRRVDAVTRRRPASHDLQEAADLAHADAIARGFAHDTAVELVEVLARATAELAGLDVAPLDVAAQDVAAQDVAARDVAAAAASSEPAPGSRPTGNQPAERLTAIAAGLLAARSDFTSADLRDTDLAAGAAEETVRDLRDVVLDLRGVRWSARTQWPCGWADKLRQDSVEIAPGQFEIR